MTDTYAGARGLTDALVAGLVGLSGGAPCRFDWRGVSGTSRPASATRRGLRLWMRDVQDGLCPDCGSALDNGDLVDFCHVVSRGLDAAHSDEGKGWTMGNLFLGHRACNKLQQARGPVVLPSHLTRPDLVPVEWPSVPTLKAMAVAA